MEYRNNVTEEVYQELIKINRSRNLRLLWYVPTQLLIIGFFIYRLFVVSSHIRHSFLLVGIILFLACSAVHALAFNSLNRRYKNCLARIIDAMMPGVKFAKRPKNNDILDINWGPLTAITSIPTKNSCEDFIYGQLGVIKFASCELTLIRNAGRNSATLFQGCLWCGVLPFEMCHKTVWLQYRDDSLLDESKNGMQKRFINIADNDEFNKLYQVFCRAEDYDEVLNSMQKDILNGLLRLQQQWEKPVHAIMDGNKLYIAINHKNNYFEYDPFGSNNHKLIDDDVELIRRISNIPKTLFDWWME